MTDILPPYSRTDSSSSSLSWSDSIPIVYSLRQSSSKVQTLLPFAAAPPATYKIKRQRTASLLSNRPDFVISKRTPCDNEKNEPIVAGIRFLRSGPLPWVPRAQIYHGPDELGSAFCQTMVLRRMHPLEWVLEVDGVPHTWQLMFRPVSLNLINLETYSPLARFIYGEKGTAARDGQEVGRFEIHPPVGRDLTSTVLEEILSSAWVVIAFARDLGKQLANQAAPEYVA